jgi:hypothetical protein
LRINAIVDDNIAVALVFAKLTIIPEPVRGY